MKIICNQQDEVIEPCVATIGFFDGVHVGHRFLIDQVKAVAANEGLRSALITFPIHPSQVITGKVRTDLLTPLDDKSELLALTGVDYCFLLRFDADIAKLSAKEFMVDILQKQFNVKTLIIGYDHRFGHNRSENVDDYRRYGLQIGMEVFRAKEYIEGDQNVSSSVVRKALLAGNITLANRCLGYLYYIDGIVVSGNKIGRTLGFPTANLQVDDVQKLIPVNGVYAVSVEVDGAQYHGMLNIGNRPTMNNGTHRTIEANIFDFSEDIYGKAIRVSFIERIRSEVKFEGLEKLVAQLHKDKADSQEIFEALQTQ